MTPTDISSARTQAREEGWLSELEKVVTRPKEKLISEKEATRFGVPADYTRKELDAYVEEREKKGYGNKRFQGLEEKEYTNLDNLVEISDRLNKIKELKKKVDIGPYETRAQKVSRLRGEDLAEFTELERLTGSILAEFIKDISGAAVSEGEAARLAKLVPNIEMQDSQFNTVLKSMEEEHKRLLKLKLSRYGFKTEKEMRDAIYGTPQAELPSRSSRTGIKL